MSSKTLFISNLIKGGEMSHDDFTNVVRLNIPFEVGVDVTLDFGQATFNILCPYRPLPACFDNPLSNFVTNKRFSYPILFADLDGYLLKPFVSRIAAIAIEAFSTTAN